MKLTKKDKLMLVILGVILLVAVFYMYGIRPQADQKEELNNKLATKKEELTQAQTAWAEASKGAVDDKIIDIIDYYYEHNKPSNVHPVLDKIEVEQMMYQLFNKYNIKGYATQGWNITSHTYTETYDEIAVSVTYHQANIAIPFQIDTREHFLALIDDLNKDPYFRVLSFSLSKADEGETKPDTPPAEGEPAPDEPTPDESDEVVYRYSGNINLEFFMGDKYETKEMPKPMKDVDGLTQKQGTANVIKFNHMEEAKGYEFYQFLTDENGKRSYMRINNVTYTDIKEDTKEIEATIMTATPGMKVVVVAVGDYKDWYKTLRNDANPYVEFEAATVPPADTTEPAA